MSGKQPITFECVVDIKQLCIESTFIRDSILRIVFDLFNIDF